MLRLPLRPLGDALLCFGSLAGLYHFSQATDQPQIAQTIISALRSSCLEDSDQASKKLQVLTRAPPSRSLDIGTAGQPLYNGSAFAAYQDVIIVSANYRTNGLSNVFTLRLLSH